MTTGLAEITQLSDAELSDLYYAGGIDLATVTREWDRRDDAKRAADKRRARAAVERAAWLDAAHAQYLQASAECNGRLLARGANLADELSLWGLPEPQAWRMASEELQNFWDVHGRLSLAEYRRQMARDKRAARDERDLAEMPAPAPAPKPARPAPAQARPAGSIARYITALGHLRRQADSTARALARVQGGAQR